MSEQYEDIYYEEEEPTYFETTNGIKLQNALSKYFHQFGECENFTSDQILEAFKENIPLILKSLEEMDE